MYKNVKVEEDFDFFKHKQLISFSLIIMGGLRGRIDTVFTLNYDSLLEWYLSIFGFKSNSIYKLPYKKVKCDVEVFHPHGYLPHTNYEKSNSSDKVILTRKQADRRLGDKNNPWFDTTLYHLSSKVFLFIGMSESTTTDRLLSSLFTTAHDRSKRTLGIWVFRRPIDKSVKQELNSSGIAPLILEGDDAIANFILEICKKASLLIKK